METIKNTLASNKTIPYHKVLSLSFAMKLENLTDLYGSWKLSNKLTNCIAKLPTNR